MSTDTDTEIPARDDEDSLEDLQNRSTRLTGAELDIEDFEDAEGLDLPDMDLPGAELDVKVIPQQADEFTCTKCYLVLHRSQRVPLADGAFACRDCTE